MSNDGLKFQSLIGILVNCNVISWSNVLTTSLFQSLIGILVNCNVFVGF